MLPRKGKVGKQRFIEIFFWPWFAVFFFIQDEKKAQTPAIVSFTACRTSLIFQQ